MRIEFFYEKEFFFFFFFEVISVLTPGITHLTMHTINNACEISKSPSWKQQQLMNNYAH